MLYPGIRHLVLAHTAAKVRRDLQAAETGSLAPTEPRTSLPSPLAEQVHLQTAGQDQAQGHAVPLTRYPAELATSVMKHLDPESLRWLAQVDRAHRRLASGLATASLLMRRNTSILARLGTLRMQIGMTDPGAVTAREGDAVVMVSDGNPSWPPRYLPQIVELLGSPPAADGSGGSGILVLPKPQQAAPLALLQRLAREINLPHVAAALQGRADEDGRPRGLAFSGEPRISGFPFVPTVQPAGEFSPQAVFCALARHTRDGSDVRSVLGRAPDEQGHGGSGILGLPPDMQGKPLRLLCQAVGTREDAQSMVLLVKAAADLGDAQALRHLISRYRLPRIRQIEGGLDALRALWAAACDPHAADVQSLWPLRTELPNFPVEEREVRLFAYLAAWEQAADKIPESRPAAPPTPTQGRDIVWAPVWGHHAPFFARVAVTSVAGHDAVDNPWACTREGLVSALRSMLRSVPEPVHPRAERRIQALEQRFGPASTDA